MFQQQIPQDMYPRPPKLLVFERPAWLEFCRKWVAYAEDCSDLSVKAARICKSFEGAIAVSVRSSVGMGKCDDLTSEWRQISWETVRSKVDEHFKLTSSADDLRPVYSGALILDGYDSFRSMHVALTVFESALARKDAELGSEALPAKTKRDIVKKALELAPLCKFWLESLTFETASEIITFLLQNVSECVVFERKFGHAPGCKTSPSYRKGGEAKVHSLQEEVNVAVQKAMSKLPKTGGEAKVVPLAALAESKPKQPFTSKWPLHSGPDGCGRNHPEGDCYFVGKCKDGKITCSKEERNRIMRSRLGSRSGSSSSAEPSPPTAAAADNQKKRSRRRTPSPHPNSAGAVSAGVDTNKDAFYSCPPRNTCCCAHMFLEESEAVSVMLDTGTLANFVDPAIAERYKGGCEVQPWSRRIRTGDTALGCSSERIRLRITREKGSIQTTSMEWFIIFPTGFDMIIGLPPLERWGWVQWGDIRQTLSGAGSEIQAAFLSAEGIGDWTQAESLGIVLLNISDRTQAANSRWQDIPHFPTTGGKAGLKPVTAHRVLSDDIPDDDYWSEKRARRRQEVSDAQWLMWQSETFWKSRDLSTRSKRNPKRGGLRGSSGRAGASPVPWANDPSPAEEETLARLTAANTDTNRMGHPMEWTVVTKEEGVDGPRSVRFAFDAACKAKMKLIGTRWAARRTGAAPTAVLMSIHTESQEYQLRAQACRLKGDEAGYQFYIDLDERCLRAGKYDKRGIFSETSATPAKADDMVIRLMPGAENNLWRFHCPTRRYTPPQQAEIRRQLSKMLRMAVIERAGPNAVVSAVHLARKPTKPGAPPPQSVNTPLNNLGVEESRDDNTEVMLWTLSASGEMSPSPTPSVDLPTTVVQFCSLSEQELQGFASRCGAKALEELALWSASADVVGADGAAIKWRFCIDYRKINSVTVDEYYPMPTDRECIEYLAGGELFGSSDVSAMYWQFGLAPESRHLTAFATEDGVWQFRRVPFGLKNAVSYAQAAMRKILRSDDRLRHVWNYIDDTFWATKGANKYRDFLTIVDALFEVCAKFNIRLSSDKTVLGRERLNVLGHLVDRTGVRIDEGRKSALCNFKRPTDTKEVQAFMGATGYIRSFIPEFSTVAYPLTGMKKFVWGAEQERAFVQMKSLIRAADILCNPDYSREFYLKGDASEKGCGAVLFQLDDKGKRQVIAYASKKFCARESKWRVMERELFSIIFGLQRFRCFVQGCAIHVVNDHKNLVWLKSNDTSSKLTRWSLVLDEIAIKSWTHAPGSEMGVEDGLSRGGGEDQESGAPPSVAMSERERILLEEEDIQLSALKTLGAHVAAFFDVERCRDADASVVIDMEAEADILLSTLVAMRQAWIATAASSGGDARGKHKLSDAAAGTVPKQAVDTSTAGLAGDSGAAALASVTGQGAHSPVAGEIKPRRLGAKEARATPAFIASGEERRGSMRSQSAAALNARDASSVTDRGQRAAARPAKVAAAEAEAATRRAAASEAAAASARTAAAATEAAAAAARSAKAAGPAPPGSGMLAAAGAARRRQTATSAQRQATVTAAEAAEAARVAAAAEAAATAAESAAAMAREGAVDAAADRQRDSPAGAVVAQRDGAESAAEANGAPEAPQSTTASPANGVRPGAAAGRRGSPAERPAAQQDGAAASGAGAAADAGRGVAAAVQGAASRPAAASPGGSANPAPAARRRAPTPSIADAERQGRRLAESAEAADAAPEAPPILSQKEKEAGLAAAAKAMLQQARRLASTARAVAADNVRWRQARQTDAPVAYDGQIRQREARRGAGRAEAAAGTGEQVDGAHAQEPRVLLVWSELGEARKKEFFEGAHTFPHDHPGVVQTVKRLLGSGRFSLDRGEYGRMFEDVTRWRKACPVCQMLQEARSRDAPVSAIPSRPFFDTSVDFLDISADVEGHTSVCAVVDNFSGFTQLYPCKRKDARTAVRCLLRTFADLGKPCTLRSDQGPAFENHVCNEFNRRMGIKSYRTIPHHHQANGIVEKVNGRALRMLSACVLDPKCQPNVRAQWADVLPFVQLAINRTVHARTRVAPCSLIYGEGFLDLGRGLFDSEQDGGIFTTGNRLIPPVSPDSSYVADLAASQAAVLERAMRSHSEYLAKALAGRQVVAAETFVPGQYVLVDFPSDQSREDLTPRWTGPFQILQQSGSNTYTVLDSARGETRDVASAQLVRFNWDWFEGVEGDETAMQEHARRLAALAPQSPRLTPKAILAARTRKSKTAAPRSLALEAGRGQLKLASCEFQVSFEEDPTRMDWLSTSQLEDEPVFHAFLNQYPGWREGNW